MGIRFKVDILNELKKRGFTSYRLRHDKELPRTLNQSALQRLREGKLIAWDQLGNVCSMLEVQPGDLLEYVEDEKE